MTVKVARLGWRHIRREVSVAEAAAGDQLAVLLALGVPLAATGVLAAVEPNGTRSVDYFHLIASAWWTLLLQWHLWRYLGRAVSASVRRPRQPIQRPHRSYVADVTGA